MRRNVLGATAAVAALAGLASTAGIGIATASATRVIAVSVKKFEFSVKEITVRKGETVVIELTSEDRVHGLSLPAFGVRGDAVPGAVTRIVFTPDRAGSFEYLCDVFCGDGHEDITGTLIVKE
jgi:cytochrome c oxidase subunit II